jgi:hypothetical protein
LPMQSCVHLASTTKTSGLTVAVLPFLILLYTK